MSLNPQPYPMRFYLKVAHVDDNDCDLYSFSDVRYAAQYILDESLVKFMLSDCLDDEFLDSDYTFIQ